MKELDIKEIWKTGNEREQFSYSEEAIEAIVKQSPQNIVSRFVKTLNYEKWANLIILSGIVIYLLVAQYWAAAAFILAINAAFYLYYTRLIRQLDEKAIGNNVIEYLYEVHRSICRFIRHFKITLFVIGTASFGFGFYLGYLQHDSMTDMIESLSWWRWVLAFAVIIVSLIVAYTLFYYMYGKKARQIQDMIDSLDELD